MSFTYVPTIPAAGNNPSVDQPTMQANYAAINGILAVDHVSFNTNGGGEHLQVTFNSNNVPTVPTSPPVLFTNNDAYSLPQLFFYTGNAAHSSSQYAASSFGSTMLLGGIIIKWGNGNANSPGVTSTFTSAFPNNCYTVTVTGVNPSYTGNFAITGVGVNGFTATRTAGSGLTGFYYLAIGN